MSAIKMNKSTISLIASVLVGLTFILSGTGKIFGHETVSSQVIDFVTSVVPDVFLTPFTVAFLYNIFIPYLFPWVEFILGCFLLLGFVPRLAAVLCLPLDMVITSTNIWAIAKGSYATCASCFGLWENIFGTLSPVQSLTIDLILLVLVLLIFFLHPGGFLSSRAWMTYIIESKIFHTLVQKSGRKIMPLLEKADKAVAMKPRIFKLGIIVIIGLVLIIFGVVALIGGQLRDPAGNAGVGISDVSIKNISETGAIISWTTDRPVQSHVMIYNKDKALVQDVAEKAAYTAHLVGVGGLMPGTLYYFHVVTDTTAAVLKLASAYSFTTVAAAEAPLALSDIGITANTGAGITVIWTTNKPATGEVEYWKAGSTEHATAPVAGDPKTEHKIALSNLEPGARYYYMVKSSDTGKTETAASDQKTFTLSTDTAGAMTAPDFELQSLDGKMVRLSDYKGKVVLLDFWQSSCADCRAKMTVVQGTIGRLSADKAAILAIHVEGREAVIRVYVTNEKVTVPVLLDLKREVSNLYNVKGVPTVFFIDGDGVIRMKDVEFETPEELLAIFDSLINAPIKK